MAAFWAAIFVFGGRTKAGYSFLRRQTWTRLRHQYIKGCTPISYEAQSRHRFGRRFAIRLFLIVLPVASLLVFGFQPFQSAAPASTQDGQSADQSDAKLPRGKKLVLKDGSFHMVREYKVDGQRVRFYSVERSQWEELPTDMVDWPATEGTEAARKQADAALAAKIGADEKARKAVFVSVDASVEVSPGVFLPDGEGIFILDGKNVSALPQAETDIKLDKKQTLKQILVPIPIIPSRQNISLLGERAKVRSTNGELEFYMRTKDGHTPDVVLIHARVQKGVRQIENLDRLFGGEMARRNTLSLERWELVKGVTRLTLSAPLAPGEYAVAEIVRGSEEDLYVWDFGIDPK